MYDSVRDPYCYSGTSVLRNTPGIRTQDELDAFEAVAVAQRSDEALPAGRLSVSHYRAIHHHLFQDVYPWAGKYRTVPLAKDGSAFCYPEHISREMDRLFASLKTGKHLSEYVPGRFADKAARFMSTLNAIHPFREGNGRTQLLFLTLIAARAGHELNLEMLEPRRFLAAMIDSFHGDLVSLADQIQTMVSRPVP